MSRLIKFRAWDSKHNYMAYQGMPDIETLQSFMHHFGDDDLMQFTGLHDKDGKEIYEGDIISFEDDPKGVVKWNEKYCCWECWSTLDVTIFSDYNSVLDWAQMNKNDEKNYILHGNKYENPELL